MIVRAWAACALVALIEMAVWAPATTVFASTTEDPQIDGNLENVFGGQTSPGNYASGNGGGDHDGGDNADVSGNVFSINPAPECFDVSALDCFSPRTCAGPPPGLLHDLYRNGVWFGTVCVPFDVPAPDLAQVPVLTVGMVAREFRRLSWPTAELTVAPPGGRTLVNLATIFSTDLVSSQTQSVRLLGQEVRIEATPTSYTWHAGDGVSWVTTDPGSPYTPGAVVEALNTHTYVDGSVMVAPSVDVTYAGRYRVNGGGWVAIPETLTVPGAQQALEVVEAANQLVTR